jgi:glutamate synthase (NADPH/NADH) large chain
MAFTDGRQIGATLDRNGLRPARFVVTDDDYIVMASEVGVLDIPERKIVTKWRLQPGKMLLVDTEQGRIIDDAELKRTLATAKPIARGSSARGSRSTTSRPAPPLADRVPLLDRQQAFGYTQEDLKIILAPMARSGEEAIGSMGNDAALPVLSRRPKVLYSYFKQLFAQVTNPPIDPIREELVMSLVTFIGPRPNLLAVDVPADTENLPMRLEATQPILTNSAMEKIRHAELFTGGAFRTFELDICYPASWGANGMEAALASISAAAEDAINLGYNILVVSDRKVSADLMPIPALLATAAVHQHLVRKGLRTSTGLVVETGSAREVHHFALLAGYGAEAVHPYLALETLSTLSDDPRVSAHDLEYRFIKAISKGLYKVMSKMGISTYQSYCGAQIFEAVGLQRDFVASISPARRATSRASVSSRSRKRRTGCTRRRSAAARSSPMRSKPAASTCTASAAKTTCGRRTRSPSCSTRRAPATPRRTRSTRADQRSDEADAHAARALRAALRARADSARGRRAARRSSSASRPAR